MLTFEHSEAKFSHKFREALEVISARNSARAASWEGVSPDCEGFDHVGPRYVLPPDILDQISLKVWHLCNGDAELFKIRMDLVFDCTVIIADQYVPRWADKKEVCRRFLEHYLDFLHEESDQTVKAIAAIQGSRANYWNDGLDNPVGDYEIQNFLQSMRCSGFEQHIASTLEALARMPRDGYLERSMREIPKNLEGFRAAGLEHRIPEYLVILKAASGRVTDSAPSGKDALEHFRSLENGMFDPALTFRFILSYFQGPLQHGYYTEPLSTLRREIEELAGREPKSVAEEALQIACVLNEHGLDGAIFLTLGRKPAESRRSYLQYALDVSQFSRRAANLFLLCGRQLDTLPNEQRATVLNAGKHFIRFFGDQASSFYDAAGNVMLLNPDRFDDWAQSFAVLGSLAPQQLAKFCEISPRMIREEHFEEFRCTVLYFAEQLKQIRSQSEGLDEQFKSCTAAGAGSGDVMFNLLFSHLERHHQGNNRPIPLEGNVLVFADDLLKAYKNQKLPAFCHVFSAVSAGINYNEFCESLDVLLHYPWLNSPNRLLRAGFGQPGIPFAEKMLNLQRQQLLLVADRRERRSHKESEHAFREELSAEFEAREVAALDFESIASLYFMYSAGCPAEKLKSLFAAICMQQQVSKAFLTGKLYKELNVSDDCKLTFRTQSGTLSDAMDDLLVRPPYFMEGSRGQHRFINRLLDEEFGILHIYHEYGAKMRMPVGVARFLLTNDAQCSERIVYVGEIEAYPKISATDSQLWMQSLHESLVQLAQESQADQLIYNGMNLCPVAKQFTEYLQTSIGVQLADFRLKRAERRRALDSFVLELVPRFEKMLWQRGGDTDVWFEGTQEELQLAHDIARNYHLGMSGYSDLMSAIIWGSQTESHVEVFDEAKITGFAVSCRKRGTNEKRAR